jgi:hypothetical protein
VGQSALPAVTGRVGARSRLSARAMRTGYANGFLLIAISSSWVNEENRDHYCPAKLDFIAISK